MQRRTLVLAAAAATFASSAPASPPTVLLELFTSEGCSSCPPADALLGELARQPGVVALAWHVDYWNGLGWRDPYATSAATNRQRAYAARLQDDVYTPALVVNGAAIVVGSDRRAIAKAIAQAPPMDIPVTLRRDASGVTAEVGAAATPVSAWLAVFDPMRITAIGGGENDGRRLKEFNIVRQATLLGTWQGPARQIAVQPAESGLGMALLVQTADLRIAGAAALPAAASPAASDDLRRT